MPQQPWPPPGCRRRRHRPFCTVPSPRRFCAANPDTAHNNCAVDQELTDAEIDRLQAENVGAGNARAGCNRLLTDGGGACARCQHAASALAPTCNQLPVLNMLPCHYRVQEQGGGAGGGGTGGGGGDAPQQHKRPPVWQLITSNNYTHRERKEQVLGGVRWDQPCCVGLGRAACWR